ncbi:MAG TPA: hypothetical protein GX719_07555 [Gammaproteobacteria bacterium]|nr:hypothetical protein [Gammaproteobacteria bacterium]
MALLLSNAVFASAQTLEPPKFSHVSGFYAKEFRLTLSHPEKQITLYYTLDGSDPEPDNLSGSTFQYKNEYVQRTQATAGKLQQQKYITHLYEKSIAITERRSEPDLVGRISTTHDAAPDYLPTSTVKKSWSNKIRQQLNRLILIYNSSTHKINGVLSKIRYSVGHMFKGDKYKYKAKVFLKERPLRELELEYATQKGTVVRAMAVAKDQRRSEVVSKAFFVANKTEYSLPTVNLTVPNKTLFDYNTGVFVAGVRYDRELLKSDGEEEPNISRHANWLRFNQHIPVDWFMYDPLQKTSIEQTVDMRNHGGFSRRYRFKSVKIYPRDEYQLGGMDYAVFNDRRPLGLARLYLKNGGQTSHTTYLTDAALQRALGGLNFGTQRYRPVVLFINGEYQGIRGLIDKQDQYYLMSKYGIPSKKVDILRRNAYVQRGTDEHWQKVQEFVKNANKDSPEFITELASYIDIDSFIDYKAAEIYVANMDWPSNNVRHWRYSGSKKKPLTAKGYTDGRWRWLVYDLDEAGRKTDLNMLEQAIVKGSYSGEAPWAAFMLRSLLESPEFKHKFITRFSDLINTTFLPERMTRVIRATQADLATEMPRHIARWKQPESMEFWRDAVDELVGFFVQRPDIQRQHLQEFFELNERYQVRVELSEPASGTLKLNSLTLGVLNSNEDPVTATALGFPWQGEYFKDLPLVMSVQPAPNYRFSHWESEALTAEQSREQHLILHPQADLNIRAVMVED